MGHEAAKIVKDKKIAVGVEEICHNWHSLLRLTHFFREKEQWVNEV